MSTGQRRLIGLVPNGVKDVSVLATLQKLLNRDVLAEYDKQALLGQLKSQWGWDAAAQILDSDRTLDEDKLRTL